MKDETTPEQALEELEEKAKLLICNDGYVCDLVKPIYQALAEHEKQKQILEVLKNKTVDINLLCFATSVEQYNKHELCKYYLTKNEFDLIKEWLK